MKNLNEAIEQNSKNLNVSKTDSKMFISSVIISLQQTLLDSKISLDKFETLDNETKEKFVAISIEHASEKIKNFASEIKSYKYKRDCFVNYVASII